MSGADIGGDESVQWRVEVDHVRNNEKLKHEPRGGGGWLHQGIDETDDGDFTITIRVPADAAGFFQAVHAALNAAQNGALPEVSFPLPIVGGVHDQIRVRWNSRAFVPGSHIRTRALMKGSSKKKSSKKKGSKKKSSSKKSSKKKASKKKGSKKR